MIVNNQLVSYTLGNYSGIGKVVGVATIEQAEIGFIYIVEDLMGIFPNDIYSYGTFSIPESLIEIIE